MLFEFARCAPTARVIIIGAHFARPEENPPGSRGPAGKNPGLFYTSHVYPQFTHNLTGVYPVFTPQGSLNHANYHPDTFVGLKFGEITRTKPDRPPQQPKNVPG